MKKFNIAKSNFKLFNSIMLINECYGNFNGIIYKIRDFNTYSYNYYYDEHHFKTYVYYVVLIWNNYAQKWIKTTTKKPALRELGKFLNRIFQKNNITCDITCKDARIVGQPYEKKYPQPQYNIKTIGYVLNTHVMTDDVVSPRQVGYYK